MSTYLFAHYQSGGPHGRGGGKAGEGEDIELLEFTFAEAREQLSSGAIRDAKLSFYCSIIS